MHKYKALANRITCIIICNHFITSQNQTVKYETLSWPSNDIFFSLKKKLSMMASSNALMNEYLEIHLDDRSKS